MAAPGCTHRACEALPRSTTRTDATQKEIIWLLIAAGADIDVASAVTKTRPKQFFRGWTSNDDWGAWRWVLN